MSWYSPGFLTRLDPVAFRKFLEDRGPTFVKLGQFLALRPDLLPQEYCDELIKLLDRVPPFSWEEARAILTAELGRDPRDIFLSIDQRPLAAGSLAQVHRAVLPDGTEVAVKVQRPHVAEVVRRDLRRGRLLAWLLERSGVSLVIAPGELVKELSSWLTEELDFRRELANLTRLHKLAAESAESRIPRPYPELSTARVLTATYLPGIRFTEILRAIQPGVNEPAQPVSAPGIDYRTLAEHLVRSTLEQIFRWQFFHADLHPGNLLALPDNVIGYVDFGLCDELDTQVRGSQLRYLTAVYNGDRPAMFKALTEILVAGPDTDLEAFRREFEAQTRELAVRRGAAENDADRSPFGKYLIGLMRSAQASPAGARPRALAVSGDPDGGDDRAATGPGRRRAPGGPGFLPQPAGGRVRRIGFQRREVLRDIRQPSESHAR